MQSSSSQIKLATGTNEKAMLKPSQVTQTSNIFGPTTTGAENEDDSSEDAEEDDPDVDIASSSDELAEDDDEEEDEDDDEDEDEEEEEDDDGDKKPRKKNNPQDFALAMQKILSAGLTVTNRKNPILVRSVESKKLDEAAEDERLELKVRKQMTAERRANLDKNHNAAVLGHTDEEVARTVERERTLRKVAQRGVVRLFNAIRAAQAAAKDGEAGTERDARTGLKVRQGAGVKKREAKAQELSKSSFLELIKSGGKKV